MKRLVLLGAGALHRELVRRWAIKPPRLAECAWVVPASQAVVEAGAAAVLAGLLPASAVRLPLAALAEVADLRLVTGRAVGLTSGKSGLVLADGRVAEFDLLCVDLQAASDLASPWRCDEALADLKGLKGALTVEDSLASLELIERLRERACRAAPLLLVAGRGLAGAEVALAAAGAVRHSGGHVAWACGPDGALHADPPALRQRLLARLRAERVAVLPDDVVAVQADQAVLSRGTRAGADLVLQLPALAPSVDVAGNAGAAIWVAPARPDRARLAPWWQDQIGRFLGGGTRLTPPPLPAPPLGLITGRGRALLAGHGLMLEGPLAGWWYRRRLGQAIRAAGTR